ncbi:MAG TPA: M56 family metallopeptidase [Pyrinomonadaceae bacterium]|nr:M56 family metallopeptidase [Pyrinomonadaceae bacterium]
MFELLGLSLLLAALLTFNSFASLVTDCLWRTSRKLLKGWSAVTRARLIFLLRTSPALISLLAVLFLFVPSYLAYEPRHNSEAVSAKLALLALVSAIGLSIAVARALFAWRLTRRLAADWLREARTIDTFGLNVPAYSIQHTFPVIAIVGVLRPRLFIAEQVLDLLSPEEISAALSHESGHLAARDNLKRGVLRACRDFLLIVPCGRELDRDWAHASEEAADERAADQGSGVALDLASALVKIARIIPAGARPAMPAGVFLFGEDDGRGIKGRVRHLLNLAAAEVRPGNGNHHALRLMFLTLGFAVIAALVFISASYPVFASIHTLIEHAVSALG